MLVAWASFKAVALSQQKFASIVSEFGAKLDIIFSFSEHWNLF